eukprot:TRINITY_DN15059_c0_g2_i1.p1 TRINITY_DN15059_c0_g2~~TRINITY_DN15059_c0_g2_i1.p1  ORF type:complete len:843 (+),score=175.36 TRINITY_DN15059_c0_g2_i1:227-2530(+)
MTPQPAGLATLSPPPPQPTAATEIPTDIPTRPPTSPRPVSPAPTRSLESPAPQGATESLVVLSATTSAELDKQQTLAQQGGVASFVAAPFGGSVASVGLRMASSAVRCDPADRSGVYHRAMSPLQWELAGSMAAGALLGNVLLIIGCSALGFAVSQAARTAGRRFFPRMFTFDADEYGLTRFPSGPLLIFALLYQGCVLAAVDMVLAPTGPMASLMAVSGGIGIAVCVAIPFAVTSHALRDVPQHAFVKRDAAARRTVWTALFGSEEWVSRQRHHHWVLRWASMVRPYRQQAVWYVGVNYAASFAVSALSAAAPEDWVGCGHQAFVTGAFFVLLLCIELWQWPYLHSRNAYLDALILMAQAAAMFCLAVGYYGAAEGSGEDRFRHATNLLTFCLYALYVRIALEGAAAVYVLATQRRTRLQEEEFQAHDWLPAAVAHGDRDAALGRTAVTFNTTASAATSPNGTAQDLHAGHEPLLRSQRRETGASFAMLLSPDEKHLPDAQLVRSESLGDTSHPLSRHAGMRGPLQQCSGGSGPLSDFSPRGRARFRASASASPEEIPPPVTPSLSPDGTTPLRRLQLSSSGLLDNARPRLPRPPSTTSVGPARRDPGASPAPHPLTPPPGLLSPEAGSAGRPPLQHSSSGLLDGALVLTHISRARFRAGTTLPSPRGDAAGRAQISLSSSGAGLLDSARARARLQRLSSTASMAGVDPSAAPAAEDPDASRMAPGTGRRRCTLHSPRPGTPPPEKRRALVPSMSATALPKSMTSP